MSELRERMKMDMELRCYSPINIKNHINHVSYIGVLYFLLQSIKENCECLLNYVKITCYSS